MNQYGCSFGVVTWWFISKNITNVKCEAKEQYDGLMRDNIEDPKYDSIGKLVEKF